MRWFFPWLWGRRAPEKRPARACPTEPRASQAQTEAPAELFLEGEDAQRPVNLSGGLEMIATPLDRGVELLQEIQRLRARADDPVEQELLKELERGLGSGGLQLPPMPQVILRVHRLIDSGLFNMEDLARGVELDPALATRMVGVANSPFYAGLEPAQSVRDAIVRIGMIETRNILMAILLRSRVFRVPGFQQLTQDMWEHSLAASVTSRALAAQLKIDPDVAFLGGLVHDVGRAVILSCAGDLRRRSRGRLQPDITLLQALMERLHAPLGAIVIESWYLGDDLAVAIAHHHQPEAAPEPVRRLAQLMAAGDELAKVLRELGEDDTPPVAQLGAHLEPLGLSVDVAAEIMAEVREEFEELGKVL